MRTDFIWFNWGIGLCAHIWLNITGEILVKAEKDILGTIIFILPPHPHSSEHTWFQTSVTFSLL